MTAEPVAVRLRDAAPHVSRDRAAPGAASFVIEPGGSHVLVGRPGSGKSALVEMLAMASSPARGAVELFGVDVSTIKPRRRFAVRRRIGMIFQDLRLIDDLSVFDNVALAARATGRGWKDFAPRIDELLAWVGLARLADDPANRLDDDSRRRLALARAVINRPDLIIADEPAGETGLAMLKLLSDLNRAGTAVLIATEDEDLARRSGAEITHMDRAVGFESGALVVRRLGR
jgi:cell division transport system ATP-binding protein